MLLPIMPRSRYAVCFNEGLFWRIQETTSAYSPGPHMENHFLKGNPNMRPWEKNFEAAGNSEDGLGS